jgi:hypothetical protein
MKRTPKENPSIAYLKVRERKKWQLGFRRYVIEGVPSAQYAPYFGLDYLTLRKWFELQFTTGLNWENFADKWQFDHIVPTVYFDFSKEEDLKLCWNFINLRVEPLQLNKNRGNRIDVLAVKVYFEDLFEKTSFSICQRMIEKINQIELSNIECNQSILDFMFNNKEHLENISSLTEREFNRFNQGMSLEDILLEREILKKYGL